MKVRGLSLKLLNDSVLKNSKQCIVVLADVSAAGLSDLRNTFNISGCI